MDHPTLRGLASAVREAIETNGLTINRTADLASIPRTTFKRHLKTGRFDSDEQVAIADVLGTSVSALWAKAEQAA